MRRKKKTTKKTTAETTPIIDDGIPSIAVGILLRQDGYFLLTKRVSRYQSYPGYWEFPCAPVEGEDTPEMTIKRIFQERLGVIFDQANTWVTRVVSHNKSKVRLHVYQIVEWVGDVQPIAEDTLKWCVTDDADDMSIFPYHASLIKPLSLPRYSAITCAFMPKFMLATIQKTLENSEIKHIHIREKRLKPRGKRIFADRVIAVCEEYDALCVYNVSSLQDLDEAKQIEGLDGIHLTTDMLHKIKKRPDFEWVGASCHNQKDIEKSNALGCDYIYLSPVNSTPSHPEAKPLGWAGFEKLAILSAAPVYALGGMMISDLNTAQLRGGHGIASLRNFWRHIAINYL